MHFSCVLVPTQAIRPAPLWLKMVCKPGSTAHEYLLAQLAGFAEVCPNERVYHLMTRFLESHSCAHLHRRQKELWLNPASFLAHIFLEQQTE